VIFRVVEAELVILQRSRLNELDRFCRLRVGAVLIGEIQVLPGSIQFGTLVNSVLCVDQVSDTSA